MRAFNIQLIWQMFISVLSTFFQNNILTSDLYIKIDVLQCHILLAEYIYIVIDAKICFIGLTPEEQTFRLLFRPPFELRTKSSFFRSLSAYQTTTLKYQIEINATVS